MTLRTPVGRVHYPSVHQAREFNGQSNYQVTLSFADDADLTELEEEVERVAREKWPKGKPKGFRSPFIEGDPEDQYLAGRTVIRLKSNTKPQVVDRDLEPIVADDPDGVYPGCYGRCSVSVFAYERSGSNGVSIWMNNFQKLRDGERIGGRSNAESDFSDTEALDLGDDDLL